MQTEYRNKFNVLYESDDESDTDKDKICLFHKKRTDAFNLFQDKRKISQILYKTKMCNRINCDKEKCNFAHKPEELRLAKCIFDESCQYMHSKTNPCPFIHKNETLEEFKIRTGLSRPGKKHINITELTLDDELEDNY